MPPRRRNYIASPYMAYFPRGVRWLLGINLIVFLICYLGGPAVQYYVRGTFALSERASVGMLLMPHAPGTGLFVWQVFTYMFVHFDVLHALFNLLGIWMFGMPIEQAWGTRRFLKFYFSCGLAAGVCVLLADILVRDSVTVGASGAVLGLMVAFGILFPDAVLLIFFLFPMKARFGVWIYVAVEILITLPPNSGISTMAHVGGVAYALVYLKQRMPSFRFRLPDVSGAYRQWKMQRAKKKFQVYMRKHGGRGRDPWVN